MKAFFLFMLLVGLQSFIAKAQPALGKSLLLNPVSYLRDYTERAQKIASSIQEKSNTIIDKLERAEQRIVKKMARKDSAKAAQMAASMSQRYAAYRKLLSDTSSIDPLRQVYVPGLDSATVLLRLLDVAGLSVQDLKTLSSVRSQFSQLQQGLTRSDLLQQALVDRVRSLQGELESVELFREVTRLTKKIIVYRSTLQQLRHWASEPDRLMAKVLSTVSDLPVFRRIFERYSLLSSILPPSSSILIDPQQVGTMQVRSAVMTAIGQTSGITNINQVVQHAGSTIENPFQQVKDKVQSLKSDKQLDELTDNTIETGSKSFLKRLEWGTNFQTVRSTNFFPVTTDMGMSVGFRINDRSVLGIGASYKMGWGKDFRHIRLSHEGLSLRSFLNARLKGSFHATGGWECHYQQPFEDFRALPGTRHWRQSAMVGIAKKMNLGNRFLKSTQVQLLVDLLAINSAYPPLVFRVGYQFTK